MNFFQVCFIGRNRTYKEEHEAEIDGQRAAFIQNRTTTATIKRPHDGSDSNTPADDHDTHGADHERMEEEGGVQGLLWANGFEARKPEEAMSKSCMKVEEGVKTMIISTVFKALLEDANCRKVKLEDSEVEYNMGGEEKD